MLSHLAGMCCSHISEFLQALIALGLRSDVTSSRQPKQKCHPRLSPSLLSPSPQHLLAHSALPPNPQELVSRSARLWPEGRRDCWVPGSRTSASFRTGNELTIFLASHRCKDEETKGGGREELVTPMQWVQLRARQWEGVGTPVFQNLLLPGWVLALGAWAEFLQLGQSVSGSGAQVRHRWCSVGGWRMGATLQRMSACY